MTDAKPNRAGLIEFFQRQPQSWLSLSDLTVAFHIPERTLRSWLAAAIEHGDLESRGNTKARAYRFRQPGVWAAPLPAAVFEVREPQSEPADQAIFSPRSAEIIRRVRGPLFSREPCSYREEWLRAYQPNVTSYLPPDALAALHENGRRSTHGVPAGTYARKIYNRLLIDLSYNSSRLEGNTYSLLDTEKLVLEGIAADGKLDVEKAMILNHREAIRYLVDGIHSLEATSDNIRSLHYLLAEGLVAPGEAGNLRGDGVRISSSTYIPWEGRERLENQLRLIADTAAQILDPFEQSLFLLAHVAYLQGFIDVNKRTSRMAANIPLVRHNLVPLSFGYISTEDYASAVIAVYELNDIGPLAELYLWSYLRSCGRYGAVAESVGIDTLRVLHRQQRKAVITRIVCEQRHGEALEALLVQAAGALPVDQQSKFMTDARYDLQHLSTVSIGGMGISRVQLQQWLARAAANRGQ